MMSVAAPVRHESATSWGRVRLGAGWGGGCRSWWARGLIDWWVRGLVYILGGCEVSDQTFTK